MKKFFTKKVWRYKNLLYFCTRKWDGSSVGLERMLDRHEVTSSILVRPTKVETCHGASLQIKGGSLAQLV